MKIFALVTLAVLSQLLNFNRCKRDINNQSFVTFLTTDTIPSDPCVATKAVSARITAFYKDSLFTVSFISLQQAIASDDKEHIISFGKDSAGIITRSAIKDGNSKSATVPSIKNFWADMHNHTNNACPGSGDVYGLIDISKKAPGYLGRFVLTADGKFYALAIIDSAKAFYFNKRYPRQSPATIDGQPAFPELLVDEFRSLKYEFNCTEEMSVALLLQKYETGIALFRQTSNGVFRQLITVNDGSDSKPVYHIDYCSY